MPVFDIDDLSFFRALGLGLRHVERERGIKESRDGGARGDAVSLSNYGHDPEKKNPPLSIETCKHFQIEVERFIFSSYFNFHMPVTGYSQSNSLYNDAAFLLIDRGNDARYPYDFGPYPLGKCGSKAFSAKQVVLLITSDQYDNDDLDHAAYNTFIDLKNRIRQLKIHAAQQLLERFKSFRPDLTEIQFEHIQAILKTLISYYQNNIFIESTIFIRIFNMASNWPEKNRIDEIISTIQDEISKIAPSFIKTDSPILIKYQPVNFDELTVSDLKLKLIHYIQNQNLSRVNDCLARLPKKAFANTEPSPLQYAASLPNTEILRVVYHYDPDQSATPPPPDDNKHKIQKILATLKENILQKKHGRSAWFSRGVDNKVTQLTKVETWLAGNSVNKENESIVLGQIRDACAIKRNALGFFKPHSLTEYEKLLDEHQLTYPGRRPL